MAEVKKPGEIWAAYVQFMVDCMTGTVSQEEKEKFMADDEQEFRRQKLY